MTDAVGHALKVSEWPINHTAMVQKSTISVNEGSSALQKILPR